MSINDDIDNQIAQLKNCEYITEPEVKEMWKSKRSFSRRANVQKIFSFIIYSGDVHGHIDYIMELFKIGGQCTETNYLWIILLIKDLKERAFLKK